MADDRIQLNLVLNEDTVRAVESRVRNLVNRLNNQPITLNINGRNLNNIISELNTVQQQIQRLNNTSVNINANLTTQQQQYRLETERLRVAQQLELSRQRTLQTENQAISALAQQNRTLTINNNITHQIEQGVQNVGQNMQTAGGHANDFVTYLENGVRHLVVYRSLYAVMNQIGESLTEMKNVDTALVSVRKTTGMSSEEIEKIRKESYGVATEYGRVASEYLESVSEFARGGYKELSTELGKVSLLTQNVGDVSADSANKMLLAIDAAYKLKGNVESLTNVVNGLNNIANLNPTSMQKMADGLQVSASMAQVAGLEISDLVALIGTGTAVTQREGSEIARAIRTVLMNIRAVKGELEDGTVIDGDSIAKAEEALNGVGIATKEVVNGVRQLRNPMEILKELSGIWSSLNSEAQSILLESIGNKRQANVLSSIISNWSMVEKMQSEFFNSANSAIVENQLYLDSWEAKSAQVSAKWTEYVNGMADTSLIKGSLDALFNVLSALDTPLGRFVTQMVLVNTALTLTGRLWGAIRARSLVADIISLGVAERNLGEAIQLVSGHLGRQALAWAASPAGMATIAVAGITLITSAVERYKQKIEETADKAGEAYDKVKADVEELDSLIKEYNDLHISGEWDDTPLESKKKLQEDINKLLGDEADKIDIINTKHQETTKELYKQKLAKLPESQKKAFDNEQAKGASLWSDVYWDRAWDGTYYDAVVRGKSIDDKELQEKYKDLFSRTSGTPDNFQDFLYVYHEMERYAQDLYDKGYGETDEYDYVNEFVTKFKAKVQEWEGAYGETKRLDAEEDIGNILTSNEIGIGGYIDNIEEYQKVVETIKSIWGGEHDREYLNILLDVLQKQFPQFSSTSGIDTETDITTKKAKENAEKLAEAWEEEHLESLKDGLKQQEDLLNRYKTNLELTDWGLDLAGENDFSFKAGLLNNKLEQVTAYGVAMREEFERVANIIPKTGEEAQALASRLESLGSDMRDNVTVLRETQVAMQQLKIESLSSIGEYYLNDLESELDDIERRIELLHKDNKEDYKYTNEILSMKTLLPTRSSFSKQLREKSREDQALIELEQTTQDKINEIVTKALEMQIADNAKAREKERQALLADMETTRQIAKQKYNDASNDYKQHGKEVEKTTDGCVKHVTDSVNNMNLTIPKPDLKEFKDGMDEIAKIASDASLNLTPFGFTGSGYTSKMVTEAKKYVGQTNTNGQFSNGRNEEWCADFISYLADQAGVPVARLPRSAGVYDFYNHFTKMGTLTKIPTVGSIAVKGMNKHVGIVIAVDGGMVTTIEGNTGNKNNDLSVVSQKTYTISDMIKQGYMFGVYASGTKDYGIAGENYKKEFAIDKKTGVWHEINKPTLFDKNEFEIVGEKVSAKIDKPIPMYADGTISEDDIKKIQQFQNDYIERINQVSAQSSLAQAEAYNNEGLSTKDKQFALFDIYQPIAKEAAKIGSESYAELLQGFNDYLQTTSEDPSLYSQEVVDAYIDALDEIEDRTYEFEDKISGIKDNLVGHMEDELSDIDEYIDDRKFYNDWSAFADSEVDAIERQIDIVREYYKAGIISVDEYNDRIKELEKTMYEVMKSDAIDVLNRTSSQIGSLKTLQQSYYNVVNSVAEAQCEINKELTLSKTMYEYLDEDTRKLLFNQKDYNVLSSKLVGIQNKANQLQNEYNQAILNASPENIAEITSHYEMQYETLMKSYEIAKADLEIAKKKQQLNNVLNERNVRMLINGKWEWVANTQDVMNAQSELAEAEYAKQQARDSLVQTEEMHDLIAAQDKLSTTINKIENGIVNFDKEVLNITGGLGAISSVNIPALESILDSSCSAIKGFAEELTSRRIDTPISYSKDFDYSAAMAGLDRNSYEWQYLNKKRNAKITGEGLSYTPFATGTKYTPPGNALMGEKGWETYIDANGHLIPIDQPTIGNIDAGGIVFNQEQMENARRIWDMSNVTKSALDSMIKPQSNGSKQNEGGINLYGGVQVYNPHDYNDFVRQLTQRVKQKNV